MKNSGEDYSLFTAYSNIDGVIIGGMWILSFLCFVGEFEAPLLSFVALAFGLGSAIMLVMRVRRFRDKALGGYITFGRAMLYSLQICFKATLLMAVAQCVYFQFIDHGFIINSYTQLWDELMTNTPALVESKEIIKETIDSVRSLNSINITMQLLSWDVFWGSLLAIPTALMVMKRAKPGNDEPAQS